VVIWLAYRKSLDGRWICSWNCGFEDYDIGKVAEHETEVHCSKKGC
jgi:hypothetical protein